MKIASSLVAIVFSSIVLYASPAQAQRGPGSSGGTTLDACLAACAPKVHVCVANMEYHIDVLCKGVPECDGLGADAVAAGSAMCKACADNSQPAMCPSATAQQPKPATTGNGNRQPATPRTVAAQPNTCAARGGVEIPIEGGNGAKACFTLKGAHDRIAAIEARVSVLEEQIKKCGQTPAPIPPAVTQEVEGNGAVLRGIYQRLQIVDAELAKYALSVEDKYRGLEGEIRKLVQRVTNLEGEVSAVKNDVREIKSRSSVVVQPQPANVPPPATEGKRQFAFSLSAYWGADTFKQYDQFQQAPGLELAMYHRLGAWDFGGQHDVYVQILAGGGQPGASDYGGRSMYELHAGGGLLHNGEHVGLGYGAEFLQRRTTSHHDVRSTFVGGYIEPRINIYGGLFLSFRVGAGMRHAQGPTQDRITNHFDMPVQVGLGYQIFSW